MRQQLLSKLSPSRLFTSLLADTATRTMSTSVDRNHHKYNPFTVHSTFRDDIGRQVKPYGLEWHMSGDPVVYYAPISSEARQELDGKDLNDENTRRMLVEAHNRWSFAKDIRFRKVDDIDSVEWTKDGNHVSIAWKEPQEMKLPEQRFTISQIDGLLRMDASAKGKDPPCQVWINGYFAGMLQPDTTEDLVAKVRQIRSLRLVFRKQQGGIIRIERMFRGRIVGQEVYEHVLDNLYALEDPEIVDDNTIIGTATLPDWIMGGELTSRLWVSELENGNILCLRPLYHDDENTSDRTYMMRKGKDDVKIAVVKKELERIRYLASLEHPFMADMPEASTMEEKKEPTEREFQHKRNRRRFFGL